MIHYYDDSSEYISIIDQHDRLAIIRELAKAGIPSMLWGVHAAAYAHCCPLEVTARPMDILVPDDLVEAAASLVSSLVDVYRLRPAPHPELWHYEQLPKDDTDSWIFRTSKYFEVDMQALADEGVWHLDWHTPRKIAIHPQSAFHIDVNDPKKYFSRAPPMSSENSVVRFPTRGALLDGYVAWLLDPSERPVVPLRSDRTVLFICDIMLYTTKPNMEVEDDYPWTDASRTELKPELEAMVQEMSPETEFWVRHLVTGPSRGERAELPWEEASGRWVKAVEER